MGTQSTAGRKSILSLALKALDEGRVEQAIQLFQLITTTNPECFEAHFHLGRAFLACGRLAPAEASFRAAAVIHSDNLPALCALGQVLFRQQKNIAAREVLETVLRLNPHCREARETIDLLPRLEDHALLARLLDSDTLIPTGESAVKRPGRPLLVLGVISVFLGLLLFLALIPLRFAPGQ